MFVLEGRVLREWNFVYARKYVMTNPSSEAEKWKIDFSYFVSLSPVYVYRLPSLPNITPVPWSGKRLLLPLSRKTCGVNQQLNLPFSDAYNLIFIYIIYYKTARRGFLKKNYYPIIYSRTEFIRHRTGIQFRFRCRFPFGFFFFFIVIILKYYRSFYPFHFRNGNTFARALIECTRINDKRRNELMSTTKILPRVQSTI